MLLFGLISPINFVHWMSLYQGPACRDFPVVRPRDMSTLIAELGWSQPGGVITAQVETAVAETPGLKELDVAATRRAVVMGTAILVEEITDREVMVGDEFTEDAEAEAWKLLKAAAKTIKAPAERRQRIIGAMTQAVNAWVYV
jgi:hypothetical protein